jgi:GDP-L-fucose synthase
MKNIYQTQARLQDFNSATRDFFKNRTVCVTGGTGFIGSHTVEQLLLLGAKVVVPSRQTDPKFLKHLRPQIEVRTADLAKWESAREAINGCDVVLNMAAEVAGIEYNKNHPASIFQNNLSVFFNVIRAAEEQKVERFLVCSSACVYPRHCSIPTPETEGMVGEPEPTNSGYGWAKRMEEYLGQKYAEEYGLSVAIARPYNSYGPRDNFEPASSHVIPALIKKALDAEGDTFDVWGDGSHSRSFLYVDDFARGCIEVAARYAKADPVNIGAFEEITIRQTADWIAEEIAEIRGRELKPKFNPQGITGQPRRMCDTTRAEQFLGYKALMSFKQGLKATIRWYLNEGQSRTSHAK